MSETPASNVALKQMHVMADLTNFAKDLQKFVKENKLSTNIQGNEYVLVDGWKFAGLNFGIVPLPSEPVREDENHVFFAFYNKTDKGKWYCAATEQITENVEAFKTKYPRNEKKKVYRYKCSVELKNTMTGEIVGSGSAVCTNIEKSRADMDEYAILSMSQTRAIAKAYRNTIGFIMKMAGFEPVPAEEMDDRYASGNFKEGVLEIIDAELQAKIKFFKDNDKLVDWASTHALKENKEFRALVSVQFKKLNPEG